MYSKPACYVSREVMIVGRVERKLGSFGMLQRGMEVSVSKCLRSDQKIGQAGCQGADPLKTRWLVFFSVLAFSIQLGS